MGRNRLWRFLAAITVVIALSCAPTANAKPTSPLCDSGSYRQKHPLICDTGGGGPFNLGPGGGVPPGGGGGGGLLDTIGDIVGGLTGGIL